MAPKATLFRGSMGGLVAFEMARELRRRGKSVALVALIDRWVPCLQPGASPTRLEDIHVLQGFALELGQMAGHEVPLSTEELAPLAPEARLALLVERARGAGALPEGVGLEALRARLGVYRAHAQAFRSYLPRSGHPSPIILFRPEAGALQATPGPMGGWDTVTQHRPQLVDLPGDHYSLMTAPHVTELARQLKPFLDLVQDTSRASQVGEAQLRAAGSFYWRRE